FSRRNSTTEIIIPHGERLTEWSTCQTSRRWSSGTMPVILNSGRVRRRLCFTGSLRLKTTSLISLLFFGSME
uniref:Uncharacterized protein n=1 Tax=Cucumis melo TaxID=3656 RepID=A0A9I9CBV3_CUCME